MNFEEWWEQDRIEYAFESAEIEKMIKAFARLGWNAALEEAEKVADNYRADKMCSREYKQEVCMIAGEVAKAIKAIRELK